MTLLLPPPLKTPTAGTLPYLLGKPLRERLIRASRELRQQGQGHKADRLLSAAYRTTPKDRNTR